MLKQQLNKMERLTELKGKKKEEKKSIEELRCEGRMSLFIFIFTFFFFFSSLQPFHK